jgi:hypothetical protein
VGVGGKMVIRLDIEIWEIGKSGSNRVGRKRGGWEKRNGECWGL